LKGIFEGIQIMIDADQKMAICPFEAGRFDAEGPPSQPAK
jgi:hypothetical protein